MTPAPTRSTLTYMKRFIGAIGGRAVGAFVGLSVLAGLAYDVRVAEAADSCPVINGVTYSRKAQKYAGGGPSTCRLSQCKPPGAWAERTHVEVSGIVWDWGYSVVAGTAPAGFCSADVESGGTSHWHAPGQ